MKNLENNIRWLLYLSLVCYFPNIQAQITAFGTETLANTTTAQSQQSADVSMSSVGGHAVVWEHYNGSDFDIKGQIFNNLGVKQGSELSINALTANDQRFPSVAMDKIGNFVVVWQSMNQDGDGWGIYGQQYSLAGSKLGGEFLVNTTTSGQQRFPKIAIDDDGDFVVVWESDSEIKAQRYNSVGIIQGGEITVNTTSSNTQNYPDVAMDLDGDFVVAWQSYNQDGSGFGVYVQRFNNMGIKQGSESLVNTTTTGNQLSPSVSMDDLGNFAIAWVSPDASGEGIFAQRFDNSGTKQGSQFQVNTTTSNAQDNPDIQMATNGAFIIAWNSYAQDGANYGVYHQSYYSNGSPFGAEVKVNTTTSLFQQFPTVAMWETDEVAIIWQDGDRNTNLSADGSNYGVYFQLYIATALLPIELLSFEVEKKQNQAILHWITTSEINNKGFEILRSQDLRNWEILGTQKGQGTTTLQTEYLFIDPSPLIGINYYQLRQLDFDGMDVLSEIRSIEMDNSETRLNIHVYPNPVQNGQVFITFAYAELDDRMIRLYDLNGRLLLEKHSKDDEEMLDVSSFETGAYLLEIKFRDEVITEKMMLK